MKIPVFVVLLTGLVVAVESSKTGKRFAAGVSPTHTMAKLSGAAQRQISSGTTVEETNASQFSRGQEKRRGDEASSPGSTGQKAEPAGAEDLNAAAPYLLSRDFLKEKFNRIYNFYLPLPENLKPKTRIDFGRSTYDLSSACERDVTAIYDSFQGRASYTSDDDQKLPIKLKPWAIRLMDSWGKSGDGILKGNIRLVGFIDECLETVGDVTDQETNRTVTFNGQYCLVTAVPPPTEEILGTHLLPLQYGSCIPSSCTEKEFKMSLAEQMTNDGYNNNTNVRCQQKDHSPDSNTWEVVGSTIILLMMLPVAVASILFPFIAKTPPIVKAFSVQGNWIKLSDVSHQSRREFSAVYGIRVLSMAWVMMGHFYNVVPALTDNPLMIPAITDEWTFQMVWGSTYAVETFFTLSGLLTTIIIMKTNFFVERQVEDDEENSNPTSGMGRKHSKAHRIWGEVQSQGSKKTLGVFFSTYGVYVIRRLIWLLPPILLVVMYSAGPSLFFMSGPFRRGYEDTYLANCRKNWWADLTFISNFLPEYPACMRISWFIAADFQMFLVAPFFLLPLKIISWKYVYTFCLVMVFSIIRGTITLARDLNPTNLLDESIDDGDAYEKYIRNMPWARAAPFFVGAFCALLVMEVDAARQAGTVGRVRWLQLLRNNVVAAAGWVVAVATALAVVFGIVGRNYFHFGPTHSYNYTEIFFYSSFTSTAWAICISWIIIMTYAGRGNGGPVGAILSHPLWVLPARFTYSVYVICYPFELMVYYSIHRLFFVSDLSFLLKYSGTVVFAFMIGIFICLFGEAPYVSTSKLLLPRLRFI